MALWQWSTTAANNATADPSINWQEGQAPSTVNDSARAMMAAVATWFQSPEWLNLGDVATYVSATQFTVPTNRTSVYTVGRRVRATVTAGTVYGTITASAYTSLTTVTLSMDGSGALDSGLSEIDIGVLNPSNSSFPAGISGSFASIGVTGAGGIALSNQSSPNVSPIKFGDGSGWKLNFQTTAGSTFATLQDNGNFTTTGMIKGADLTGTSDERLKEDWRPMARDFLERMASVLHGTFAWRSNGVRSAGVGAQSLRDAFPEVVHEDETGELSVAYGNAALVTVLELIPCVLRLLDEHGETP